MKSKEKIGPLVFEAVAQRDPAALIKGAQAELASGETNVEGLTERLDLFCMGTDLNDMDGPMAAALLSVGAQASARAMNRALSNGRQRGVGVIEALMDAGIPLPDNALALACGKEEGVEETMAFLLAKGARHPNNPAPEDTPALVMAINMFNYKAARALASLGADPELELNGFFCARECAEEEGWGERFGEVEARFLAFREAKSLDESVSRAQESKPASPRV